MGEKFPIHLLFGGIFRYSITKRHIRVPRNSNKETGLKNNGTGISHSKKHQIVAIDLPMRNSLNPQEISLLPMNQFIGNERFCGAISSTTRGKYVLAVKIYKTVISIGSHSRIYNGRLK
eukprot:TRINITY_DN18586_c1_g2_i2.p1 TRINITY_DN18586_c1_g2~~TRINITY_DN18586_c1_g2_i2.p1  ORF type:complete len:119 (+),score=11.98 TRINITY_DN18586_c1_g2_i2:416-772(+)